MFQSANGSLDVYNYLDKELLYFRDLMALELDRRLQQELGCFLPKVHCLPLPEKLYKAQFNRVIINEGYTTF